MNEKSRSSLPSIILILVLALGLGYVIYTSSQALQDELPAMANQPAQLAVGGEIIDLDKEGLADILNTNQEVTEDSEYVADQFSVVYPGDWKLAQSSSDDFEIYVFSSGDQEVTLTIMDAEMEGIVADSVSVDEESTVTISGVAARQLKGGDLKDGSQIYSILLINDGTLYNFTARDLTVLNQIIDNFTLM
ncbi:MAG: hypothetical protein ABIB97_00130 [Patescibacteria group bacterium]